ncbi:hypothetical protein ACH3VR_16470 [Microbacterium sp. B2969]|uniref:Protein-L-isoaspartate carboxylmethyltransferase n=1 Tax=Microbacterium alkaliflavum TaxID=3248839 RepID=A0ABW7QAP8_9MICO
MPFRSQRTLEAWLEEFRAEGHAVPGALKVIVQDGEAGANTGLVAVELANASTVTYIQPVAPFAVSWVVTMEPREDALVLDAEGVLQLGNELAMVADLCRFLEQKSAEFIGTDTP